MSGPRDPEPEDVEILEVVGVDQDAAPPSADEVEITFGAEPPAAAPAPVPPTAPTAAEEDLQNRLLRLRADYDNFRKRAERERVDARRYAAEDVLRRLLPILDNFERALAAAPGAEEAFREGVLLIHRQLLEELRREGLQPIEAVGTPFDPVRHEAVATESSGDVPPGTVTAELQRGWYFLDRVLRPALVRVRTEASGEAAPSSGGEER